MCGRVFMRTSVKALVAAFPFASSCELEDSTAGPRFNGAPGQYYPIIIKEHDVPGGMFVSARWGFIPRWMKDPKGGPKPINAMAETVAEKAMFRFAYRARRALMPIDGFYEWKAIVGSNAKQPYAIGMADGSPFAVAALYEEWRDPAIGETVRTFAVLTCRANTLISEIHQRMPVIIAPENYHRWLDIDVADPHDLLAPYPAQLMTVWPISRRVNSPHNNDQGLLDPLQED